MDGSNKGQPTSPTLLHLPLIGCTHFDRAQKLGAETAKHLLFAAAASALERSYQEYCEHLCSPVVETRLTPNDVWKVDFEQMAIVDVQKMFPADPIISSSRPR